MKLKLNIFNFLDEILLLTIINQKMNYITTEDTPPASW
jgi:hypothetical protein